MTSKLKKIISTGIFIAIGIILPQIFHLLSISGKIFLPMHIPIFICGMTCGGIYGFYAGIITVAISSVITGAPVPYPEGVAMCAELAAYGFVSGYVYKRTKLAAFALIAAMISGRIIYGTIKYLTLLNSGVAYGLETFIAASFLVCMPGILFQFITVPVIVKILSRAKT